MFYSFRAVDKLGKSITGEREVASERELADVLRHEGFLLLEAEAAGEAKSKKLSFEIPNPFRRVTLVERMLFARYLAVMIGAGLVLNRGFEALEEQSGNPKFKKILIDLRTSIVAGKTFSEGLKPYEKIFGILFINMVEAGEISGNLVKVLKLLAKQMKRDHDIRAKVRGALIYPAIVLFALGLIGVLMMIYVVPTLTQTFKELDVQLPLTTRIIIATSNALLNYYWYIGGALAAVVFGFTRLLKSPAGKRIFDKIIILFFKFLVL